MLDSEKRCPHCDTVKPRTEFYRYARGKDGLQNYCKVCCKSTAVACARTEHGRERARQYRHSEHGKTKAREYASIPEVRARKNATSKRYRERNLKETRARIKLNDAIDSGKVVRPEACERCGRVPPPMANGGTQIHGHHHDYSRPLDVVWLCVECHEKEHHGT